MSTIPALPPFEERELVVAFFDLSAFMRYSRTQPDLTIATTLVAYYEAVGDWVEEAGGQVVKFLGDGGLLIYPAAQADVAVTGLLRLKREGGAWWAKRGVTTQNIIKANTGPVYCAPVGTRQNKQFDVFGETVNTAAILPSHGVALTPALFRKLSPNTRREFKKHTPPITYIPVAERHRD